MRDEKPKAAQHQGQADTERTDHSEPQRNPIHSNRNQQGANRFWTRRQTARNAHHHDLAQPHRLARIGMQMVMPVPVPVGVLVSQRAPAPPRQARSESEQERARHQPQRWDEHPGRATHQLRAPPGRSQSQTHAKRRAPPIAAALPAAAPAIATARRAYRAPRAPVRAWPPAQVRALAKRPPSLSRRRTPRFCSPRAVFAGLVACLATHGDLASLLKHDRRLIGTCHRRVPVPYVTGC
jgi:hypothetical protein